MRIKLEDCEGSKALEASSGILSVILAPCHHEGGYNVLTTKIIDPPMLFCLDVRNLRLTPQQPARWMRAKLTLVQLDGTEVINPDIKTLRDILHEERAWWTWPEFVRPGQRVTDAKGDEQQKIYFLFDGIRIPTLGGYFFQVKVEEDLSRVGSPDGPFKEIATIRTPYFECIAPSSEECDPGDKELARADAIFKRLPKLRLAYDPEKAMKANAVKEAKKELIKSLLKKEEEDSD